MSIQHKKEWNDTIDVIRLKKRDILRSINLSIIWFHVWRNLFTETVHTHADLPPASKPISTPVKNHIKELFTMKLKNRTIRENLATKYSDDVPSGNQIKNYVKNLNKEKFGDTNISLGEMEA